MCGCSLVIPGFGAHFPAEIAWASLYAPAHDGFIVTVRDASDRHQAEAALRERDEELARATRFAVAISRRFKALAYTSAKTHS